MRYRDFFPYAPEEHRAITLG